MLDMNAKIIGAPAAWTIRVFSIDVNDRPTPIMAPHRAHPINAWTRITVIFFAFGIAIPDAFLPTLDSVHFDACHGAGGLPHAFKGDVIFLEERSD